MGDRSYCTLTFWKGTHVGEYQALMQTITDLLWRPDFHSKTPNQLSFGEVNCGELPDDIRADLINRGFSYTWDWDPGSEYSAGVEMYDAASNKTAAFMVLDGEIVLGLDTISNPHIVENARNWNSWLQKPKTFAVIDSPSDDFLISLVCQKEDVA